LLKGVVYAGSGFVGIFYIMFMQHRIRSKMSLLQLLIIGFILLVLTFSPLTGAIAIFGPDEAARIRFPAYEQWRMITFGHYFEHVDFFSVYQWLVGAFMRISLGIFLIPEVLNIPEGKKRMGLFIVLCALVVGVSQIPISDKQFMTLLCTVTLQYTLFLGLFLSFLFAAIAWINPKKKVKL